MHRLLLGSVGGHNRGGSHVTRHGADSITPYHCHYNVVVDCDLRVNFIPQWRQSRYASLALAKLTNHQGSIFAQDPQTASPMIGRIVVVARPPTSLALRKTCADTSSPAWVRAAGAIAMPHQSRRSSTRPVAADRPLAHMAVKAAQESK